jgi:hypothetical protein
VKTYRTRSRTFEALLYDGDNPGEVMDELFELGYASRWHEQPCPVHASGIGDHIVIDVPKADKQNGHWLVKAGDYIIFDQGRITTCRSGMFLRLYEVV